MISVETIFQTVQDLVRKDVSGGYASNEEFNLQINLCQNILYNFYYSNPNESMARESLLSFQLPATIAPTTPGVYARPALYKDKLDCRLLSGGQGIPVHFPARDELFMSYTSPIRGASLAREVVVGEITETTINIQPETDFSIQLRYYIIPPDAYRAVTLNLVSQIEVYDAANTIDLQWDTANFNNFVDLMMMIKGIILRDSTLLKWVQERNIISQMITS